VAKKSKHRSRQRKRPQPIAPQMPMIPEVSNYEDSEEKKIEKVLDPPSRLNSS